MTDADKHLWGNIGDLSELYVLGSLLAKGQVEVIDADGNPAGRFIKILGASRCEATGIVKIERGAEVLLSTRDDASQKVYKISDLESDAQSLLAEMQDPYNKTKGKGVLCPSVGRIVDGLQLDGLKAKSSDKADVYLKIADPFSVDGTRKAGFTVKSYLSEPPTLVNAGATIFVYQVDGLSPEQEVAASGLKHKELVRWLTNLSGVSVRFLNVEDEVFGDNLAMIDLQFGRVLAAALLSGYRVIGGQLSRVFRDHLFIASLPSIVERPNPSRYAKNQLRNYLKQSALGMQPSEAWLGDNEVSGGAIIMEKSGVVRCLCLDLDEDFKGFLFDHCKFDTPSGGRHGVGELSKTTSGTVQLKLSLQIRFCSKEV
jgi:hypothetical protein